MFISIILVFILIPFSTCRYEYQINYLEEKVRRLTRPQTSTSVPVLSSSPSVTETKETDPDVNEQFLNLLDTDTAAKFTEIEEKCKEMEKKKIEAEEKLKVESEKNEGLLKSAEDLKTELENMEELKKANAELEEKLVEAGKNEMDMFLMDAAPEVESTKEDETVKHDGAVKDAEIVKLQNKLDEQLMETAEKELELKEEIAGLKNKLELANTAPLPSKTSEVLKVSFQEIGEVIKDSLVGEDYQRKKEMDQVKEENSKIKHELELLKLKVLTQEVDGEGEKDLEKDREIVAKLEAELLKSDEKLCEKNLSMKGVEDQLNEEKNAKDSISEAKQLLEKEIVELKENMDEKINRSKEQQNLEIETLKSELARTKLLLDANKKEVLAYDETEHKEVSEGLGSLPDKKRKLVPENFDEDAKKLRLENQAEGETKKETSNTDSSMTELELEKAKLEEELESLAEPSTAPRESSTETLLAATPVPKTGKPANILFMKWAQPEEEEDASFSTLEDTVC